jgi:hypothetical protein
MWCKSVVQDGKAHQSISNTSIEFCPRQSLIKYLAQAQRGIRPSQNTILDSGMINQAAVLEEQSSLPTCQLQPQKTLGRIAASV